MTASYYPEEDWYAGDWFPEDEIIEYYPAQKPLPVDLVLLALVAIVIASLVMGLSRLVLSNPAQTVKLPQDQNQTRQQGIEESPPIPIVPPIDSADPEAFIMPYTVYQLTQGPHGVSYGHYAIDIAAGKGEPILSPINGYVSELYTDAVGNPTLVIENAFYEVTMLHGNYKVQLGQEVTVGDPLGTESNKGNTRDMNGNSCRNRDCGYHTHLNVFDKQAGQNVNPLDLLSNISST
jgi:murein DD-endopeptidase MepM/ murein hydrolase activator NlpD